MSNNPLLIEMVARQLREEHLQAAAFDRLTRRAERQQRRQRGRLFALLTRFLTAVVERQPVTRSAPSAR